MVSKEEARAAVLDIAANYGYIDDLTQELNPTLRAQLDERFLRLETVAAGSIKTLAKQIYGSGARFIFELLQNAEDNCFDKAEKREQAPFLAFYVHPTKIIVECNEDGFSEEDLRAICAVGESTKTQRYGYIGAKGIGFKSVFIAAWKVHILSGVFSFKFQHKKGDPGLGMVRPEWVEVDGELDAPVTRMTLSLHEDGDEAKMRHMRDVIVKQFHELQRTCLLFLQKIKSLYVEFYDEDGKFTNSTHFQKDVAGDRATLKATFTDSLRRETVESEYYHITKHTATGIAKSENRDEKSSSIGASTAEIVLAFQLTEASEPMGNKQQIFAFLPMRHSDFRFLIQSDFDTNANREDVLKTSRRNLSLLDPIADTFVKAVLQFCEHPELCYKWPHFLPLADECSDSFWASLFEKIKTKMSESNLLRSRNRKDLRKIAEVCLAAKGTEDMNGVLYLDDPVADPFLSPKYGPKACSTLQEYGLEICRWDLLIKLLESDLKSPDSKMKDHLTDPEWHSGVARLFSLCFEIGYSWGADQLKRIPLLPLRDGRWVASVDGPTILPRIRGVDVPAAIDLRIIDALATANKDRETFFEHLGALTASVGDVRLSINRAYWPSNIQKLNVGQSTGHLHFLYLTHRADGPLANITDLRNVALLSKQRTWTPPHLCYLPGDSSFGAKALLEPENGAPGYDVPLVQPYYMEDTPQAPGPSHMSWESWLRDFLGVRERLRLTSVDRLSLSDTFNYVAKHRPEKFLGLLQYLWKYEGKTVVQTPELLKAIKSLPAQRFCGPRFPSAPSLTLEGTCVPSPQLRARAAQYMDDPDCFPFLFLEDDQYEKQLSPKWSFLSNDLKLHHADDIQFLSLLLMRIKGMSTTPSSVRAIHKICELYVAIEANIKTSTNPSTWRNYYLRLAKSDSFVLVPSQVDGKATWSKPYKCIWEGPEDMMSKHSLRPLYSRMLGHDEMVMLDDFFTRTLEIPCASTEHVVGELRARSQSSRVEVLPIKRLYQYLSRVSKSRETQQQLKQVFGKEPLIYVSEIRKPGWYRTSDCLWTSTTEIRGKAILDGEYGDLKGLFVNKLGVKSLTLQMVYDELLSTTSSSEVEDTKNAVFAFNSLLQTELEPMDARRIQEACIFPIRYPDGHTRLGSSVIDFAIGDRAFLLPSFRDKIKVLCYTMEEVRRLTPFFEWARLKNRYLSTLVKEDTSVAEGAQRPISSKIRDLKLKAHYILRIAATFDSPRYVEDAQALYRRLTAMEIIETDHILAELKVFQDKKPFKVEQKAGDEHIEDADGCLKIYVPVNKRAQDVSYSTTLPNKFAHWLMQNSLTQIQDPVDKDAIFALTLVMTMERSALDRIFDHQGINHIPILDEDESSTDGEQVGRHETGDGIGIPQQIRSTEVSAVADTPQDTDATVEEDDVSNVETLVEEVTVRANNDSQTTQRDSAQHVITAAGSVTFGEQLVDQRVSTPSNASVQSTVPLNRTHLRDSIPEGGRYQPRRSPEADLPYDRTRNLSHTSTLAAEAEYRVLLNNIVVAARTSTDPFPSRGPFDMSDMRDNLPDDGEGSVSYDGLEHVSRFRSSNHLERDKKVGAAGELFVFEVLSNQGLSNWDWANWQSTIRHYVTVHQDYIDLPPWRHWETADIVYHDVESQLTGILIDKGYVGERWLGATPKYFIEVKTTTGPCSTPFYMSGKQYQLMQNVHGAPNLDEMYVIIRVSRLNSERPRLRVYVDPEQLRQEGNLLFTGHTWSVVPRTSVLS